jgi:hypothetical protein
MTLELKLLAKDAIPKALDKAERYRLLNDPANAESICLDILRVDADNQQAVTTLLLALTDQFDRSSDPTRARALLAALHAEYDRAYYAGIICERLARARLHQAVPGAEAVAYEGFREAMTWYEKAETLSPPETDDATLRWNACARALLANPRLRPTPEEKTELPLE